MQPSFSQRQRGFTLTEVLVSSALIVAIMALMLTTIDQTRRTINSTVSRVTQFQAARIASEAMTRNLSQATLNTYWDLDRDTNKNPLRYRRQSDLHFVSGRASSTGSSGAPAKFFTEGENLYPGHAVFFQAPIGFTASEIGTGSSTQREYAPLSSLLSVVGYYVKWEKDTSLPSFMHGQYNAAEDRYRYRLMEVMQSGETNMVYNSVNYTAISNMAVSPNSPYKNATDWVQVALGRLPLPDAVAKRLPGSSSNGNKFDFSRSLAENIVAVIILPKVAEQDRDSSGNLDDLTKDFEYDSRPPEAFAQQKRELTLNVDVGATLRARDYRLVRQLHQLPTIVQVSMVAIDEESAIKLEDWVKNVNGGNPPNWTTGMFKSVSSAQAFIKELGDPANPDPSSLIYKISNPDRRLPQPKLNYRVFTTDVVMRGAKWSKDPNEKR